MIDMATAPATKRAEAKRATAKVPAGKHVAAQAKVAAAKRVTAKAKVPAKMRAVAEVVAPETPADASSEDLAVRRRTPAAGFTRATGSGGL